MMHFLYFIQKTLWRGIWFLHFYFLYCWLIGNGPNIQFLPHSHVLHCGPPIFTEITVLPSIWFILSPFLLNDSENSLLLKKNTSM